MTNVIDSFSYGLTKAAVVQEAKDKAKREGYSFSEYILKLLEGDIQKKGEALVERLPILTSDVRQTTLNEYIINYISCLSDVSDEDLEHAITTIPDHKTNLIYEKFGTMRDLLRRMDYIKT